MSAGSLPDALLQLADYADIRGAWREADDWRQLAAGREAGEDDDRLRDFLLEGSDAVVLRARSELPRLIRRLLETGALDSAGALWLARHGVVTAADLNAALSEARLPHHPHVPATGLQTAAEVIARDETRVPLGRALDLVEGVTQMIRASCPEALHVCPVGDVRRFEPLVDALVLAVGAPEPAAALEAICALSTWQGVLHRSADRALLAYQGAEIDVRVGSLPEFGTLLVTTTGARPHVTALQARAQGISGCAREEDVYSRAGLPWIPPELRHDTGELEAAAAGTLPRMVERAHIRGDFHMHSTYSDGGDPLAHVVAAAAGLGYEYIAITDHSERSAAARTVSPAALARQADEVAALRERFPDMVILHGIEVDIMPDGLLDFPDSVLETLDIVLASLHDRAGHDPATLTRRLLGAITHPLVNVITHPLNQLVGRDTGYDMDFPAIYAAAARTGTALEIDGAPGHLDLDGAHAREAIAAGVTVTIDSDCHRARLLDKQMRMGIGTARRGWVEPRHVLNTRPINEVRAFIAAKRTAKR